MIARTYGRGRQSQAFVLRTARGPVLAIRSMRLGSLVLAVLLGLLTTAARAEEAERHTVAPGQTLGRIAKRYHVSVDALCAANGISRGASLQPGQELTIPAAGSEARSHVVSDGDTLGKIADRYDVPLEELLKLN